MAAERQESGITKDIQEEFKEFIKEHYEARWEEGYVTRHRILPEHLLYIEEIYSGETDYVIHRNYLCAPPPGKSFEELKENLMFGKACFIEVPEKKQYRLSFITKYGESRWRQYEGIVFTAQNPQESTGIRIPFSDFKEINIVYDLNGIFQKVYLHLINETRILSISPNGVIELELEEKILKPGVELTLEEGALCAHFNEEPDIVKLEINQKAQFRKEVLRIHLKIDKEKIIETLAPSDKFTDPYNADPYDDRSWLEADLRRVVGIENESPQNFRR